MPDPAVLGRFMLHARQNTLSVYLSVYAFMPLMENAEKHQQVLLCREKIQLNIYKKEDKKNTFGI